MYAQFFGNYLLNKRAITTEQFIEAAQKLHLERIKIGTLAMHAGYMTPEEVNHIVIMQTHRSLRFGELAIEEGYLTQNQVDALIKMQTPDYLLFGQILVDVGALSYLQLKELLSSYQDEYELKNSDVLEQYHSLFDHIISDCFWKGSHSNPEKEVITYLNLLVNNLIRFIGEDFTILNPEHCQSFESDYCIRQSITGNFNMTAYLNMSKDSAITFASRYTGDLYHTFDEYVQASMEDFLNLHNGLFNVNASNESSVELMLTPPVICADQELAFESCTFRLPVIYPFGTLQFLFHLSDGKAYEPDSCEQKTVII